MSDIEDIKAKCVKLLRLSEDDGAAQGEMQNAMKMAQALMRKHRIDRDDLTFDPKNPEEIHIGVEMIAHHDCGIGGKTAKWESSLAWAVVKTIGGLKWYWPGEGMTKKNKKGFVEYDRHGDAKIVRMIRFVGIDEDAALAQQLFNDMRLLIMTLAEHQYGSVYKGTGREYCEGFAAQLSWLAAKNTPDAQIARITDGNPSTTAGSEKALAIREVGIIKKTEAVIDEYTKKHVGHKIQTRKPQQRQIKIDPNARESGEGHAREHGALTVDRVKKLTS